MGAQTTSVLQAYLCMVLWIGLSSAVILINKWLLDPKLGAFPFPLALSAVHMAFCSLLSAALVRLGLVEAAPMPAHVYVRGVLPIGALFAATLWASNAAYLHLSVSFIQMIKATMPLLVYGVGVALGAERPDRSSALSTAAVVGGVLAASHGEVSFVPLGVLLQAVSLLAEATRLVMVQLLLQGRGVRLNPITTMYHVAPVCLACLLVPFSILEARPALTGPRPPPAARLLASAAAAFGLNCSVFMLVGRTSALTMNVAGVAKDWLLIGASVALYGSVVTRLQLVGYSVAMAGVFWYNYSKIRRGQLAAGGGGGAADGGGGGGSGDGAKGGQQPFVPLKQPLLQAYQGQGSPKLMGSPMLRHQQQQQAQQHQQQALGQHAHPQQQA